MAKSVEGLWNCAVAYWHMEILDIQEVLETIDQIEAVHCLDPTTRLLEDA